MPVLDVTNAGKLSLDPATPIGQIVRISDGFVASGFGDARDGFYFLLVGIAPPPNPNVFIKTYPYTGDGTDIRAYSDGTWHIGNDALGYADATSSGGTNPWDKTYSGLALVSPVVQELTSPSTAQGGVFVVIDGTNNGVYTKRGTSNGKDYFNLLGSADSPSASAIAWTTPILDTVWTLLDSGGLVIDTAVGDTTTPDSATWALSTVTSVTEGELAAGFNVGDGSNGLCVVNGSSNGRNSYLTITGGESDAVISWDPALNHGDGEWFSTFTPGDINLGNVAFPWQGTPEVDAIRNDVGAEANWEVTVEPPPEPSGDVQLFTQDDSKATLAPILGGMPQRRPKLLGPVPRPLSEVLDEENAEEEDELATILAMIGLT